MLGPLRKLWIRIWFWRHVQTTIDSRRGRGDRLVACLHCFGLSRIRIRGPAYGSDRGAVRLIEPSGCPAWSAGVRAGMVLPPRARRVVDVGPSDGPYR